MKLGIIGLPQSGKTTIFNAITRGDAPTTASAGRFEVHTAVVDVPDERVTKLSEMFNPKKTIYAKVTYADIAGLETGSAKSGISGQLLNQLSQMDGFILVKWTDLFSLCVPLKVDLSCTPAGAWMPPAMLNPCWESCC